MSVLKRILLAEDDEDDRMIFTEIVRELYEGDHIHFSTVDNGRQVIHSLSNNAELPDLIILDQNMPQLNGKETLELICKDAQFQQIPVVIYSTYNDSRLSNECLEIGARQIITKPDSFDEFREMIQMLVNKYVYKTEGAA